MKTYRTNDLRIGISDEQLSIAKQGEALLRVDNSGAIHVAISGAPEVPVGGNGGSSLSDYPNVIVVAADGSGDYTTLSAAVAAATVNDTIWVMSNITEVNGITIEKNVAIHIPNNLVTITVPFNIVTSYTLTFSGNGIVGTGLIGLNGGTLVLLSGVTVQNISMNGSSSTVISNSGCTIGSLVMNAATMNIKLVGTIINTLFISSVTANSYINNCVVPLSGQFLALAPININLNHCTFIGNAPTNALPIVGNYSNTVSGITWPAIP